MESARVAGAECLILTAGPDPSGPWEQAARDYDVSACASESGLRETIRAGVDTFRVVRVSDAAPGTRPPRRRLVPGDGRLPLTELLGLVLDAGYRGVFEIEFTLPPGSGADPGGECRRALDQVGAILDSLGA